MTDEELNNLLSLFKEGSVTNTALAVSLMQEMDVTDARRVFIGVFEFLKDKEWKKNLNGITYESRMLREDIQVLPQDYSYSDDPFFVTIYVRKSHNLRLSAFPITMDTVALEIRPPIYDCSDEEISGMLDQLLKAYGHE